VPVLQSTDQEVAAVAHTIGSRRRVPELDGLRGIAILSVILFHYTAGEGALAPRTVAHYVQRALMMGWIGVDLFFVLSGFLIGGILLDVRESKNYFKTFYLRRAFRIFPIYYLWITLYVLLVLVAARWLQAHSFSNRPITIDWNVYAHYLFLQNIVPLSLAGIAGGWFGPLWSLAIEEQFYLFAPMLVRFIPSTRKLASWLIALICLAPLLRVAAITALPNLVMAASFLMPCRADSLALGMLLALGWRRPAIRRWFEANTRTLYLALIPLSLGLAALWYWAPSSIDYTTRSLGYTWIAVFCGVLLVLAISAPQGPLARVTRVASLREIGRVSYCMYIVHLTVALALHAILLHSIPRTSNWPAVGVTLLSVFSTYVVAWVSWKVLEGPMLKKGHEFKY
jgi:peptidoglycan/LPS O-acetylase OafA/YrhL